MNKLFLSIVLASISSTSFAQGYYSSNNLSNGVGAITNISDLRRAGSSATNQGYTKVGSGVKVYNNEESEVGNNLRDSPVLNEAPEQSAPNMPSGEMTQQESVAIPAPAMPELPQFPTDKDIQGQVPRTNVGAGQQNVQQNSPKVVAPRRSRLEDGPIYTTGKITSWNKTTLNEMEALGRANLEQSYSNFLYSR